MIRLCYRLHPLTKITTAIDNVTEKVYNYSRRSGNDIGGFYREDRLCKYVYIYDAWGNCTIKNDVADARIGEVNPFRYRGYYFDSDLGVYYLKSRYYDPQVARFINADDIDYLGANGDLCSYNLFAYCSCNPVMYRDDGGHAAVAAVAAAPAIGEAIIWGLGTLAMLLIGLMAADEASEALESVSAPTTAPRWNTASAVAAQAVRAAAMTKAQAVAKAGAEAIQEREKSDEKNQYRYWYAEIINKFVVPLKGLTYIEAQAAVALEKNVLCINRGAAYALVRFYRGHAHDIAHRCEAGYLNHYHLNSNHGNHIWYYGQ